MPKNKKIIEVSLPLDAINQACVDEKFIRTGHPANLHQWWSRKPLVAARAVLFASLVDDPSVYFQDESAAQAERERLFDILMGLASWESSNNQAVLDKARLEIARSLARSLNMPTPVGREAVLEFLSEFAPTVMDPFAGGGSIPFEAQRLGLPTHASDLNPIAVLVNKAMLEIPAKFTDFPSVHPRTSPSALFFSEKHTGLKGIVKDVEYYGQWVQRQAEEQLRDYYPNAKLPSKYGGGEAKVVAWVWVHTIRCPNPACGAIMPLTSKWVLSKKSEAKTWVEPIIDRTSSPGKIRFTIAAGKGNPPEGTVDRHGARCILCGATVPLEYIRNEGRNRRLGYEMIAVAGVGHKGRLYLEPDEEQIQAAMSAQPTWKPQQEMPLGFAGNVTAYGCVTFGDLFLPRQLVALKTLSDLIRMARCEIEKDALLAHYSDDHRSLNQGGIGAKAYAEAITTYLSFALSKTLNRSNAFVPWGIDVECPVNLFSRHTVNFLWDFAESNVIFGPSGSFTSMLDNTIRALETIDLKIPRKGTSVQSDAVSAGKGFTNLLISTDPPYYDVIPYSDLSDFFYVWLRPLLGDIYPEIFSTVLTPKSQELTANAIRSGSREKAKADFEQGMIQAFSHFREIINPDFPLTVYYAYKQTEDKRGDHKVSTGWETSLTGIIEAGFMITGTWPIRTERAVKIASLDANVLASSIVLVCRPKPKDADIIQRKDFLTKLKKELPIALKQLQQGNIAPVDLAQAAIGPGMAVYSRYKQILEIDGSPMTVGTALGLINQVLDQCLSAQEGDYDQETRWALAWYEQYGFDEGPFGVAETLSKAKNISIQGLIEAGIVEARSGKVRLLRREDLRPGWIPMSDSRVTLWEVVQYLVQRLDKVGEQSAAALLGQVSEYEENARDLAYRLYNFCERKKWTQEALAYNMLVVAWPTIKEQVRRGTRQENLF